MKTVADRPGQARRFAQAFDAAQTASRWAGAMAAPHWIRRPAGFRNPHPNLNAELAAHNLALGRAGMSTSAKATIPDPSSLWHNYWHIARPLRDRRLVDVQVLGDQRRRRMCQPVGQGYIFVSGRSEHGEKLHIGVADVLHEVTMV